MFAVQSRVCCVPIGTAWSALLFEWSNPLLAAQCDRACVRRFDELWSAVLVGRPERFVRVWES